MGGDNEETKKQTTKKTKEFTSETDIEVDTTGPLEAKNISELINATETAFEAAGAVAVAGQDTQDVVKVERDSEPDRPQSATVGSTAPPNQAFLRNVQSQGPILIAAAIGVAIYVASR